MHHHVGFSKKTRVFKHPLALAAAVFVGSMLSASAWAVVDAPVREAMEAVNAKQAQKAFDLLSPLESSRAGDPDFDLALGIAANETGQSARAIFSLERVLALQPANGRARAELARAMFAVGDNANARKLLQETKELGIPSEVNRTIDEFLQAIDKVDEAGKPSIRMNVDFAVGHDSNANSGPSSSSFAVPALGLVVTLLPTGIKTSAGYYQLSASVSGRAPLAPRWSFIGNASASTRNHASKAKAFDVDLLEGNAGVSYREERNEFSGVLNLSHTTVGGAKLREIKGLTGEWTHRLDGNRQWGTYLQLSDLDYTAQPVRDASRSVLGTSYAQQLASGVVYYAGGYVGKESIKNKTFPHLGHSLFGLRGGMQMPLVPQWSLFASLGLENRDYGGIDPLFLIKRKDLQLDASIGAAWKPSEQWRITPQLNYNRSKSNIVVNDSSKYSLSVTVRREF